LYHRRPACIPIRAKGDNEKPKSQSGAPEPFEGVELSFRKHSNTGETPMLLFARIRAARCDELRARRQ